MLSTTKNSITSFHWTSPAQKQNFKAGTSLKQFSTVFLTKCSLTPLLPLHPFQGYT